MEYQEDQEQEVQAPDDDALQEGLRLLDDSQAMMRTVFLGLALQYRSLDLQRCQLLQEAEDPEAPWCGPEPKAVQTAASLVTLAALFGFQRQAEQLACQTAQLGGCPDMMDVKLGAVVILVALIRLARLNAPERICTGSGEALPEQAEPAAQEDTVEEDAEFLEDLEELAEPVI